ncbi:MAG: hypothetical protein JWR34_4330 [Mycobacterium sp.]|nr:hypothetical protein [Mycobacterium sp.]
MSFSRTPVDLARQLGVKLPGAEVNGKPSANGKPYPAVLSTPAEPVDLADHPDVKAALDKVTGNRSADIYRILGAGLDDCLTFDEASDIVRSRADLADKLAQVGGDDLTRSWIKLVDEQHKMVQITGSRTPVEAGSAEAPVDHVENAIRQRQGLMRIDQEARRRLDDETRPPVRPPDIKSLDTLLSEPDTPTRYRIDRLAPTDSRVMLSAQAKAGKTSVVGNVIRSLADGDPLFGRFAMRTLASGIVLIDDELSENTLRPWLRHQGIVNTGSIADVVSLRGKVAAFNPLDDRRRSQWATRLRDLGCDYLILDCLRPVLDALGLDESHDAGTFLTAFDALLDEAGIADSLTVQHMGHANERARGDSRLQDWPDAIWRIMRETDDPGSPRFFSAYGRDVDVHEGRLAFDPQTRRLTYAPGSRRDSKTEAAQLDVIKLLAAIAKEGDPETGLSKNHIESELAAGDTAHSQKAIRDAIALAVKRGFVRVVDGPRRAQLCCITNPCSECGMPVAGGGSRHLSCPSGPEGLEVPDE